MQKLIKKLNDHHNFHLALKVIQISDDSVLEECSKYLNQKQISNIRIKDLSNCYELLEKAYNEKINIVLCNEAIEVLLPQVVVITKDVTQIIKPFIPTLYLLKDNKIIQKVKTTCNKKNSEYKQIKNIEELMLELDPYIINNQ